MKIFKFNRLAYLELNFPLFALFGNGKTTKKEIFQKIENDFNAQSHITVTGDQCCRKWTKLTTKHKEVIDHNSKSGKDKKKWKYQDAIQECIGANPSGSDYRIPVHF